MIGKTAILALVYFIYLWKIEPRWFDYCLKRYKSDASFFKSRWLVGSVLGTLAFLLGCLFTYYKF